MRYLRNYSEWRIRKSTQDGVPVYEVFRLVNVNKPPRPEFTVAWSCYENYFEARETADALNSHI